ncbi:integrin beta-5-like [Cydia fagiglandana]|uniref:integrin beta-5-like n=1 Tax=Cydia fagiglandana TaxID=1458189 RepID=UPI002FEDFF22
MAKLSFRCFIAILFCVHWFSTPGFALDCNLARKETCDECIKCGGIWCKDPYEPRKCVPLTGGGDDWCPNHMETTHADLNSLDGKVFRPQYEEVLAHIDSGKVTTLKINGDTTVRSSRNVYHNILNTTQSDKSKVHVMIHKYPTKIEVTTKISPGFCSPSSQKFEYVFMEVGMPGVGEKAVLKYVVPCGCGCSEEVETEAVACHGFGSLVCGTCQCDEDRHGKFCQCGPVSSWCAVPSRTTPECSGNGYCDEECNKCQCFTDKEGSQYFDPQDNCKDLGATVSNFLDCQKNKQFCSSCDRNVFFRKWNETLLNEMYDDTRKFWVDLGSRLPGYFGSVIDSTIHVMRKPEC